MTEEMKTEWSIDLSKMDAAVQELYEQLQERKLITSGAPAAAAGVNTTGAGVHEMPSKTAGKRRLWNVTTENRSASAHVQPPKGSVGGQVHVAQDSVVPQQEETKKATRSPMSTVSESHREQQGRKKGQKGQKCSTNEEVQLNEDEADAEEVRERQPRSQPTSPRQPKGKAKQTKTTQKEFVNTDCVRTLMDQNGLTALLADRESAADALCKYLNKAFVAELLVHARTMNPKIQTETATQPKELTRELLLQAARERFGLDVFP